MPKLETPVDALVGVLSDLMELVAYGTIAPRGAGMMRAEKLDSWRHERVFLGRDHDRNERRSWCVVALCGAMMAAEITGGLLWGSMALIADGLHMSTHAGALVVAALAYSVLMTA